MSGAYESGYELSTEARSGTDCLHSGRDGLTVDLEGTMPDGTYTSDYVWSDDAGDLDECNGTFIDGEYVYLITDEYPYIGRCLNGADVAGQPAGPPAGAGAPPEGAGPPPEG